jgi:hypothetical protein
MTAVFDAEGLTAHEKIVALALADHAHDDGSEARCGNARIVRKTALSLRTVQTTTRQLVAKGIVEVQREATNRDPKWYRFLLTEDQKSLARGAAVTPLDDLGVQSEQSRGANDDILGCSPRTQTINEPSIESLSPEDEFERLWQHYPRKIAKAAAFKAVTATIKRGVFIDELVVPTINYAESRRRANEPQFTLHGATFYGPSERWRDWVDDGAGIAETPSDPATMQRDFEARRRQQLIDEEATRFAEITSAANVAAPMPTELRTFRDKRKGLTR